MRPVSLPVVTVTVRRPFSLPAELGLLANSDMPFILGLISVYVVIDTIGGPGASIDANAILIVLSTICLTSFSICHKMFH